MPRKDENNANGSKRSDGNEAAPQGEVERYFDDLFDFGQAAAQDRAGQKQDAADENAGEPPKVKKSQSATPKKKKPAARDSATVSERQNNAGPKPISVSALTAEIRGRLSSMVDIWVEGEISGFTRAGSGHCYLSLKDDAAQISAVIWRGSASRLKFQPTNGMQVVCRGKIDVYPPRGSYQLVIDQIEPKGVGALELAFRQLHERLKKEGLFDPDRKQSLPRVVRRIGLVTSRSGAAIRDFLEVLARRWPYVDVLLFPTRVQGDGAAEEIARAIEQAEQLADQLDLLVVTRGGGSIEDLWAFNEEPLVRAVAACRLPTVSAVGHEIDVTLCDLAADVRALTPSEAAERIVPDRRAVEELLGKTAGRLQSALRRRAEAAQIRLDSLMRRSALRRPDTWLDTAEQTLDRMEMSLRASMTVADRAADSRLTTLAARLDALSPLAVLSRGYSITETVQALPDGTVKRQVVRAVKEVSPEQEIETRLKDGRIIGRVVRTEGEGEAARG